MRQKVFSIHALLIGLLSMMSTTAFAASYTPADLTGTGIDLEIGDVVTINNDDIGVNYGNNSIGKGKTITIGSDGTLEFVANSGTYNWGLAAGKKWHIQYVEIDLGFEKVGEIYLTQVEPQVAVTGITLDKTEATMTVGGDALTLTATVAPDDAANKTVTWTTSDASVATVANGTVTAVAAGTATITATATNGTADTSDDKTATCAVTVAPTYKIAMKSDTQDAANWAANPNPAEEGKTVTLKYDGVMKVKSIKVKKKATAPSLAEATAADLGKIVGADGNIYDTKAAAETAGTTGVAMIAYVGNETDHGTYTHGLAIGLDIEKLNGDWDLQWDAAKSICEGKTAVPGAAWLLPSENQWRAMFKAFGNNELSKSGLNTALSNAGAVTVFQAAWTSVENDVEAKYVTEEENIMVFVYERKDHGYIAHSCLVF